MNAMPTPAAETSAVEGLLYLTTVSPRDVRWSLRKAESLAIADLYELAEYNNYVSRLRGCSGYLAFAQVPDEETGEVTFKLQYARFCRVRHCPTCQWRRQLMWLARTRTHLPRILADYPKHHFIFLTLTVRNCPLTELRSTLSQMSKAWNRLAGRKQFIADGWLRNVEVTRADNDYAHPHYHALLMVPSSYFNGNYYLSQKKWTELWRESMRLDYEPIVHVQKVKTDYAHNLQPSNQGDSSYAHKSLEPFAVENGNAHTLTNNAEKSPYHDSSNLSKSIFYCLKYSVKPDEFLTNAHTSESNSEWLVELTRQLHKTRSVALGGIFKEYMSEAEPEELICAEIETEDNAHTEEDEVVANWHDDAKQYVMSEADLHDFNVCLEVERKAAEFERHQEDYPIAKPQSMRTILTK